MRTLLWNTCFAIAHLEKKGRGLTNQNVFFLSLPRIVSADCMAPNSRMWNVAVPTAERFTCDSIVVHLWFSCGPPVIHLYLCVPG